MQTDKLKLTPTPKGRGSDRSVGETKKQAAEKYKAEQIILLEGLAPVRKRPAMYIGSTGLEGLHHLIKEVVDNSIDEAVAGYADTILIQLLPENRVLVKDNGRGIPVDIHKPTGLSALEVVTTKLHAGGKFADTVYRVSGGLHGVGISVVNALSSYFKAEVERNGKIWAQEYQRGRPTTKVKPIGKTENTGTTIIFEPDQEIFPEIKFNWETILSFLREQAYLTKGLKIRVEDKRGKEFKSYNFYFEGGLASFIRYLNRTNEVSQKDIFYVSKEINNVAVEVSLQYTKDYKEIVYGFANNVHTSEGGMHLVGFRSALTRVINSVARTGQYLKENEENLTNQDVREGLTAIVSVKLREPQFEGQTKNRLGNPEARTAVETVFAEAFRIFLEEHPKDTEAIISKCLLSAKAREAAREARTTVLRKGVLESLSLPGKLADCTSKNPEESELFLVEGDSAGGSAKQGRDRYTQAILPLKGKILNVEKAAINKILANDELRSLITALGAGIGEQFDLSRLRYHKIVIMVDADSDGLHIKTLLLTFFYRYFPEIIKNGYLYVAQAPLYKLEKGKEIKYVYSEKEKEEIIKKWARPRPELAEGPLDPVRSKTSLMSADLLKANRTSNGVDKPGIREKINIQRYKGLGEMNPEELFNTTMDSEKRILKKVIIEEAENLDEVFEILMGREVGPRKKFIQTHARAVQNLDV